jgi:hypothetical protein
MLCPWLQDRPVKPGDECNGIQASETERWRIALITARAARVNREWSQA